MAKLLSRFTGKGRETGFEGPVTEAALRQWLIERLARQVKVPPEQVDTTRTFESYGLDSMVAVEVSGTLERIVKRRLSPGLLYEQDTVDTLTAYLGRELDLADTA